MRTAALTPTIRVDTLETPSSLEDWTNVVREGVSESAILRRYTAKSCPGSELSCKTEKGGSHDSIYNLWRTLCQGHGSPVVLLMILAGTNQYSSTVSGLFGSTRL
jgi:hypothetical protein